MDYLANLLGKASKSKGRPKTEKHAVCDAIWEHFKLSDKKEYQLLLGMTANIGPREMERALEECKKRDKPYPYFKGIYRRVYKEIWKSKAQTEKDTTAS